VNDRKILRSEVDKYYQNQLGSSPEPSAEQATSLRLNILRELIDQEIMLQRAEKLGLLATEDEVNAKLTEIKAPYTQEQFQERLKERKMTEEDLKRDLRRTLTVQKLLNREITSKITITDADIAAHYEENKAQFNFIEPQFHLAQILVTTEPSPQVGNLKNDKAQNEPEARKKIQMLLNRLESGEDFATVAMNYSEQPGTSASGGELGFVPESGLRTDPVARAAVEKLKPGQFSDILPVFDPQGPKRPVGYRILRLIGKEPAGQRDQNDPRVQQAIRDQLRDRREQLLKSAYYEAVRNEATIENYLAQEILKNSGSK
jgi:peptidyl-prolyl cis-trans isomerase SurA